METKKTNATPKQNWKQRNIQVAEFDNGYVIQKSYKREEDADWTNIKLNMYPAELQALKDILNQVTIKEQKEQKMKK